MVRMKKGRRSFMVEEVVDGELSMSRRCEECNAQREESIWKRNWNGEFYDEQKSDAKDHLDTRRPLSRQGCTALST